MKLHNETPVPWRQWGELVDKPAIDQMNNAAGLPIAAAAALMPDAHVGYGLPIGGVLATRRCIIPYAVGVDIACRMKLSVLDLPLTALQHEHELKRLSKALEGETRFGVGAEHRVPEQHDVMDRDWSVSPVTREFKAKAWRQLGTSGSGNHFVEFGLLTIHPSTAPITDPAIPANHLKLDPGVYVALLSHSGSRGTGAAVCEKYSKLAMEKHPDLPKEQQRLAWLDLASQEGHQYWEAMNLMGDYAAANHDVIHRLVSKLLGARIIAGVENHHNFAWKETHDGREVIVHRNGATPAGAGELPQERPQCRCWPVLQGFRRIGHLPRIGCGTAPV